MLFSEVIVTFIVLKNDFLIAQCLRLMMYLLANFKYFDSVVIQAKSVYFHCAKQFLKQFQ